MKLSLQEQLQLIKLKLHNNLSQPAIEEKDDVIPKINATKKEKRDSENKLEINHIENDKKIDLDKNHISNIKKSTKNKRRIYCKDLVSNDSEKKETSSVIKSPFSENVSSRVDFAVEYAERCAANRALLSKKIIGELYLQSKRGIRITERTECNVCGYPASPVWRYAQSNHGVVHLCNQCKPRTWDHSFGKLDAMDVAYTGGQFEGNRSKH